MGGTTFHSQSLEPAPDFLEVRHAELCELLHLLPHHLPGTSNDVVVISMCH